ncbi:hypothetical protein OX284_013000 [Flavobacterium sp. SUN046]|uniref:hypothetical protein n=1 Tax=Flavobacterium sp. SUN046 TaxID=3002440 RepID=UPI002DB82B8D|nr:hypothetical protein [Flavobacterium sp. SUN046]MEC4050354.1 hypothetical protein [Flavobacterium sp. SUN046]
MEQIKLKHFISIFSLSILSVYSQEKNVLRKGLINTQLTLSTSSMFAEKQSYFYLHGSLENFVSEKISLSGEGYYYLGNLSNSGSIFNYNHSLFFGASKHFTKKNNDFYIGIQPGISFLKLDPNNNQLVMSHNGINPLISTVIGYNFYINSFFHFFVQSRIIEGENNFDIHKNLAEIRFSAGLGFNINAL